MKRILPAVAAMMIAVTVAAMQTRAMTFELSVGPKLELGMGFYSGDDWQDHLDDNNIDNQYVFTFSGGLLFDMTFVRTGIFGFGLQPEALLTFTGGGSSGNTFVSTDTVKGADISIYLKPKFTLGNGDLYILFGPDIFIPIGGVEENLKLKDSKYPYPGTIKSLGTDVIVGLGIGIGYDFKFDQGTIEIGCTFTPYLMDYWEYAEIRQNKFTFTIGYAFNVIKPSMPANTSGPADSSTP
ncbi:MAG TPA: hypothetical protein PK573_07815 [Spirochaetota bacterium]|nr:hypothetical protein [Spirochaetota bacterium]HRZ27219.1 hypothetical protein [Spirochaetota bacterium]HSA16408.1 hypothetical protein [Spirochaetota bacterium]